MIAYETAEFGVAKTSRTLIPLLTDDLDALDFTMVKRKLQDPEEGAGWTAEECDAAETEYKRFLALKRAYSDREIVPNGQVDIFWHQHILDTIKYAEDCQAIFGFFLHHYPYFGMNGEADYANLCSAFEETQGLWELHFGGQDAGVSMAKCRSNCRGCKPVKCK
jgi:hypothetical protein